MKATKEVMVKCKKEVKPIDKVKKGDYISLVKDIAKVAKKQFPSLQVPVPTSLLGPDVPPKPTNGGSNKNNVTNGSGNHSK